MTIFILKRLAIAFLWAMGVLAQDGNQQGMKVTFVNQFPDTTIDLYWENHDFPEDHPERRRLEGRIPPRGGWLSANTFLGHGAFGFCLL